jgi:hypothetical protein
MKPEPNIVATLAKFSDAELRQHAAYFLQRLIAYEGVGSVCVTYPALGDVWVDPPGMADWPPKGMIG